MYKFKHLSDEELIWQAQQGNFDAFDVLMDRYRYYSWGLAKETSSHYYNIRIDLEDLMGVCFESFFVALKKATGFTFNFFPYWKTISINEMTKYIKENSSMNGDAIFSSSSLDEEDNLGSLSDRVGIYDLDENGVLARDFSDILSDSNNSLLPEERQILRLYLEGYTLTEIASILNISRTKIYYFYRTAKEKMRSLLKR